MVQKLKIISGGDSTTTQVFVDGVEMSSIVSKIVIFPIEAGWELVKAEITFINVELDVQAERHISYDRK